MQYQIRLGNDGNASRNFFALLLNEKNLHVCELDKAI